MTAKPHHAWLALAGRSLAAVRSPEGGEQRAPGERGHMIIKSAPVRQTDTDSRTSATETDHSGRLLTILEVAELLGIPVATIYRWRHVGDGPRGYRIGRHVRFRRAEVEAWIESRADD